MLDRRHLVGLIAGLSLAHPGSAHAQAYPQNPNTQLLPKSPGGATLGSAGSIFLCFRHPRGR